MRRIGLSAAAAALILGTLANVQAALFDDEEARRQVAVERKRVDELAARASAQAQQLDAVVARLGGIEESVGKNQGLLDLFREIENLKVELAKMRGQMEMLSNGIETAQKRQKDFYVDLDTRLRRLEGPSVGTGPSAPARTDSASAAAGTASGASVTTTTGAQASSAESRAYEAAQNLRRIGNYQGAIVAFQNFLKQYPTSSLASNAQYWIGDSYFNMRDFRLAIASQRTVLTKYPYSAKVPDALLNIAGSQAELGETVAARKTMEEIVAKYPASNAADKARRRIASQN
jgi:tol-pal system protein YbgF